MSRAGFSLQDYSPLPILSDFTFGNRQLIVVRDDLLPGGSKQRGVMPYLKSLIASGRKHFVYASPFSGFAQVTLAFCTSNLKQSFTGIKSTIFCEKSPDGDFHEYSRLAKSYGSRIVLCENLADAYDHALEEQFSDKQGTVIPLGFDDPIYRDLLGSEIKKCWQYITAQQKISELWLPIGSGTLMKVFRKIVSDNIKIYGVNVNVLPEIDRRISTIMQDKRVTYIKCEKKFHVADDGGRTPVPSNIFYDAKVFTEWLKTSSPSGGSLWWNVGK